MTNYDVHGLYTGHFTVEAESEREARAQFHKEHRGWAGTIFSVEEVVDDD